MYIHTYTYIHNVCIYIYVYVERERERERDNDNNNNTNNSILLLLLSQACADRWRRRPSSPPATPASLRRPATSRSSRRRSSEGGGLQGLGSSRGSSGFRIDFRETNCSSFCVVAPVCFVASPEGSSGAPPMFEPLPTHPPPSRRSSGSRPRAWGRCCSPWSRRPSTPCRRGMYTHICISLSICIYRYIYIYIYTHVYMYIYIYIERERCV